MVAAPRFGGLNIYLEASYLEMNGLTKKHLCIFFINTYKKFKNQYNNNSTHGNLFPEGNLSPSRAGLEDRCRIGVLWTDPLTPMKFSKNFIANHQKLSSFCSVFTFLRKIFPLRIFCLKSVAYVIFCLKRLKILEVCFSEVWRSRRIFQWRLLKINGKEKFLENGNLSENF